MIRNGIERRSGGEPCVAGTRVTTANIFRQFMHGADLFSLARLHGITVPQAEWCLRFERARRYRRKADAWAWELCPPRRPGATK